MPVESQRLTVTPLFILFNKVGVAVGFHHQSGDAVKGFIPRDALPFIRARGAVLRMHRRRFSLWT